jgi:DNA-binding protein HU-beta
VAKTATKTKTASARKTTTSKATGKTAAKTVKASKAPAKGAVTKVTTSKVSSKAGSKAAAKSAKAATSASAILTLRHIAERLSEAHELPKRQANEMLTQVVEMITKSLKKGEKIRLSGLGILQVRKRAARTGRNPQTGEAIKIKASKKIAFRPAKELKEAV